MKNIIKSIALLTNNGKYVVSIMTKSKKCVKYTFSTHREAVQYYNDILID